MSTLIEISIDDGHELDRRVIGILGKYRLVGTFYVPCSSWGWAHLNEYGKHCVGNHTLTHPSDIKTLSDSEIRREITAPHSILSKLSNFSNTFCPPRGRYNDTVVEVCKESGYSELRTTIVGNTETQKGFVRDTTVHAYQRNEYMGTDWFEYAMSRIDGDFFHLWGHSAEIDRDGNWGKFERLCATLGKRIGMGLAHQRKIRDFNII